MASDTIWQGDSVHLRAVEPEDWQFFFRLEQDTSIARETDTLLFPFSTTVIKHWTAELASKEPWKSHAFRWIIEDRHGTAVGTIDTHTCNTRAGTFQYGISIMPEHRRKGYAQEAIRLVLRYFFHELRYQKVTVRIYAFNEASLQLHRRLCFQEEGRLRRMAYTDGVYHDEVMMGLTAEEFAERER